MEQIVHRVRRYHDISCGHRVVGHESKCRHLHGHNYRIHLICEPVQPPQGAQGRQFIGQQQANGLDELGRVIDFGVVKERLCMWLENNWDHKFLAWEQDPMFQQIKDSVKLAPDLALMFMESVVYVPFNPTAENMAQYLLEVIGPQALEGTGVRLVKCVIEETAKCHVESEIA